MSRVIVIVDTQVEKTEVAGVSTTLYRVEAMKKAIAYSTSAPLSVEVITSTEAALLPPSQEIIWCPLTLDVPNTLQFWGQNIFQACRNLTSFRQQVEALGYRAGDGSQGQESLYLPIVLTAKGPLYGEVIGQGKATNCYQQPVDLPDNQRQPLYHLAYQLLQSLEAPPSVYLLKFGYKEQEIICDRSAQAPWAYRLLPFPDVPALASIGIQEPNLFTCHWHCLTNQPIYDLTIIPKSA